jgi:hypothetical protein
MEIDVALVTAARLSQLYEDTARWICQYAKCNEAMTAAELIAATAFSFHFQFLHLVSPPHSLQT